MMTSGAEIAQCLVDQHATILKEDPVTGTRRLWAVMGGLAEGEGLSDGPTAALKKEVRRLEEAAWCVQRHPFG